MALKSSSGVEPISMTLTSNPLMRAFDKKAKGYLSSLHRSFSASAVGRDVSMLAEDDPSAMTVEFLRARLQSQRAEYKAERQRARVLAQKVLELEKKLKVEIQLRKYAERVLARDENEDQSIMGAGTSNEEQQEKEQNDIESANDNESAQISLSSSEGSVELGDDHLLSGNRTFSPLPNLSPCKHLVCSRREHAKACQKLIQPHIESPLHKISSAELESESYGATMKFVLDTIREVHDQSVSYEIPRKHNSASKVNFGSNSEILQEDERASHRDKHQELSTFLQCQGSEPDLFSQGRQPGANHQNKAIKVANLSDEAQEIYCLPNDNAKRKMQITSACTSSPISVSSFGKDPCSNSLGSPPKSIDLVEGYQMSSNHLDIVSGREEEIDAMVHLYETISKETTKLNPLFRYEDSLMIAPDEKFSNDDAWSRMAVNHETVFHPHYKNLIRKTQTDYVPSLCKESVPAGCCPAIQEHHQCLSKPVNSVYSTTDMHNEVLKFIPRQVESGTEPRNVFKLKTLHRGQLR